MKKEQREKIISECVAEYESTPFTEKYPSGSWKQFREDVKNLYCIVRRYFGRAESRKITADYFTTADPNNFYESLVYAYTWDALAEVK